ncbi:hypothetical protein Rhe02_92730 [Rhizocola hellebori]|uniref:Replication-relaxation n=1 Tax=Rhizocola hellebori TaxID=1392758 RepID=A0A8J3QID4_9ACTN|nr:hypothetical protein Rhe02_92730 [Rhizocola hellebori]
MLRLQASITNRDDRLLGWLYDHGVLTTDQIASALFPSLDFAQRRLLRLTGLKAITRFRPNKLDGGSYPYHYVLAQLGYEHVMGQRGLGAPGRDHARRRFQSLISRRDLPHLLGGNGVFIALAAYARRNLGVALESWRPATAFHEPGTLYRHGSDNRMILKSSGMPRPDGAGVWAEDGKTVPFFVEYDTGTESLAVLAEKIDKYDLLARYAESWLWPTLFVLPTAQREQHLHDRFTAEPSIIAATTALDYLRHTGKTLAQDVWRLIGFGKPRKRLIDLPYVDAEHDAAWSVAPQAVNDDGPEIHLERG